MPRLLEVLPRPVDGGGHPAAVAQAAHLDGHARVAPVVHRRHPRRVRQRVADRAHRGARELLAPDLDAGLGWGKLGAIDLDGAQQHRLVVRAGLRGPADQDRRVGARRGRLRRGLRLRGGETRGERHG